MLDIYYFGRDVKRRIQDMRRRNNSFLAFGWNNWDDYSYKTSLPCYFVANQEEVEVSDVRILIDQSSFTAETLNNMLADGWDGLFPIPGVEYTSVPSDIDFYSIIAGKLGLEFATSVATKLKDASYYTFLHPDESVMRLAKSQGFSSSLLREGGSRKAYEDGWRLFAGSDPSTIKDFTLNVPSKSGGKFDVRFLFNSKVLPYDVNVLIGPNGIGKSHCLQLLVEYWLKIGRGAKNELEKTEHVPFDEYPNISRLILASYSPFEDFILDLKDSDLIDKDVYKYFGFRRRITDGDNERIGISRNLPAHESVASLLRCYEEDASMGFMPGWISKVDSVTDVLKEAIEFESMLLAVNDAGIDSQHLEVFDSFGIDGTCLVDLEGRNYIKVDRDVAQFLSTQRGLDFLDFTKGIIFVDDQGQFVNLSSGQRLFSFIVVNILGALKYNSLVVVDEPELFLHPNLEITFISLLKSVLGKFKSKAILATHSLVTVREVPANCVHVLRSTEFGVEAIRPPFETFGGDIQRISSYVFGDRSISKPFEEWLDKKIKEYASAERLIADLDQEINEEMLMRIHRSERRR